MKPNRVEIIDTLKGYAILLVMIGHTIQNSYINFNDNIIFKIIYSFHMPLFMFLSGCVVQYPPKNNIKKTFIRLMIPFISWGVLSYVLKIGVWKNERNFVMLFIHPAVGLWFLYILFLINTWYIASYTAFKKHAIIGVLFSLSSFIILSKLGLFYFQYKYFILGVLCNYLYFKTQISSSKLYKVISILLAVAFIPLLSYCHRAYAINFLAKYNISGYYDFCVAICGIILSYYIVTFLNKLAIIRKSLLFFGRQTLEFYVIHQYLFILFSILATKLLSIKFALLVLITYMLILLINTNKYLKLIFFGIITK